MKYYQQGEESKVYEEFIKDNNQTLYVSPYINTINGELFKRDGNLQIYSQKTNKTKYFPDLNDLSDQIDEKNAIFNVSVLELNMNGETKRKKDMEWFFNGRKQPDQVRIVVQDCYLYGDNIIVNEKLKRRFGKVEEIVPEKEKIGIYEISTLPVEKIDEQINPAEFQAIVDWSSDLDYLNSVGTVIKTEESTVLDGKGKVIIGG